MFKGLRERLISFGCKEDFFEVKIFVFIEKYEEELIR